VNIEVVCEKLDHRSSQNLRAMCWKQTEQQKNHRLRFGGLADHFPWHDLISDFCSLVTYYLEMYVMLQGGLWKIEQMHHGNFVLKLAIYPCRSDLSFHGRVLPELSEDGFISSQVHHVLLGLFFSWQDQCRIMQNRSSFLWLMMKLGGCLWNFRFPSIVFLRMGASCHESIHTYLQYLEIKGRISCNSWGMWCNLTSLSSKTTQGVATRDKLIVWNSMAISHFGKFSFPFPWCRSCGACTNSCFWHDLSSCFPTSFVNMCLCCCDTLLLWALKDPTLRLCKSLLHQHVQRRSETWSRDVDAPWMPHFLIFFACFNGNKWMNIIFLHLSTSFGWKDCIENQHQEFQTPKTFGNREDFRDFLIWKVSW